MTDVSLKSCEASPFSEGFTPAGIQPLRALWRRRLFFGVATITTWCALAYGIFFALGLDRGGSSAAGTIIFLLIIPALPWWIVGFWNAVIGLWLLSFRRDGLSEAAPFWRFAATPLPLQLRVAVLMTIRNEDASRAIARLSAVRDSLDASPDRAAFDYFVLSDTSDMEIASAEEALCAEWKERHGEEARLTYRRRQTNDGYKAGNIRDFLNRWGASYDLMLTLDADSVMSGEAIVRLARVMQAFPKLGILQSLVVGAPTSSVFARVFQFGMRHGMQSFTMGSAWWTGDCGPYWGHNALIRVEPFKEFCSLPLLPGTPPWGGHVLSHDQIEAAFMRRAGYEVRVAPAEGGSYEDNPPALTDFTKRHVRWCQGNLQYWHFLAHPGLKLISRLQIMQAIFMFLGSASLAAAAGVAVGAAATGRLRDVNAFAAMGVFAVLFIMAHAPKFAGLASVVLAKGGAARYGGGRRLAAGAVIDFFYSTVLFPIVTFGSAVFIASMLFGRAVSWGGQARDAGGLNWRAAALSFWPQTLAGVVGLMAFAAGEAPNAALLCALPLILPLCLSIPFAVFSASPRVSSAMSAARLCAVPEEFEDVHVLRSLPGTFVPPSAFRAKA